MSLDQNTVFRCHFVGKLLLFKVPWKRDILFTKLNVFTRAFGIAKVLSHCPLEKYISYVLPVFGM